LLKAIETWVGELLVTGPLVGWITELEMSMDEIVESPGSST